MQSKSLTKTKTMEEKTKTIVEFYCGKQIATNEAPTELYTRIYNSMKNKIKFIHLISVRGDCFYRISDIKSIEGFT